MTSCIFMNTDFTQDFGLDTKKDPIETLFFRSECKSPIEDYLEWQQFF